MQRRIEYFVNECNQWSKFEPNGFQIINQMNKSLTLSQLIFDLVPTKIPIRKKKVEKTKQNCKIDEK